MSATSQNPANGKKSGSSSSSTVNTPAQTPVSVNGQIGSQPTPPLNNNAPKYGKCLYLSVCNLLCYLIIQKNVCVTYKKRRNKKNKDIK